MGHNGYLTAFLFHYLPKASYTVDLGSFEAGAMFQYKSMATVARIHAGRRSQPRILIMGSTRPASSTACLAAWCDVGGGLSQFFLNGCFRAKQQLVQSIQGIIYKDLQTSFLQQTPLRTLNLRTVSSQLVTATKMLAASIRL